MSMIIAAVLVGAAFALSAWLTRRFIDPRSLFHVLDHPNERSLHRDPVPRSGGVALLLALTAAAAAGEFLIGFPPQLGWIAAGAFALGFISYREDRYGITRRFRLLAHLGTALLLLAAGLAPEGLEFAGRVWELNRPLALALTLLYVVWMTNLYNFMDGMDGFAAGMAVSGFGALAWAGWLGGAPLFALASALTAAAAGGFLLWNFPPARIFMGDAGSATLGFLAAAFSLWAARERIMPLWGSLLLFSPFIVDASVTLLRRLLRGEKVWQAHRSHYYQRLVQAGWGHRRTVLRFYLLMGACALSALQGMRMAPREQLWLLAMWTAIYLLLALKVRLVERGRGAAPS